MIEDLTEEEQALLSNKSDRLRLLCDTDVFRAVQELLRAVGGVEHSNLYALTSLIIAGQTSTFQPMAQWILNDYSRPIYRALCQERSKLYEAALREAIGRRRERRNA